MPLCPPRESELDRTALGLWLPTKRREDKPERDLLILLPPERALASSANRALHGDRASRATTRATAANRRLAKQSSCDNASRGLCGQLSGDRRLRCLSFGAERVA